MSDRQSGSQVGKRASWLCMLHERGNQTDGQGGKAGKQASRTLSREMRGVGNQTDMQAGRQVDNQSGSPSVSNKIQLPLCPAKYVSN